MYTHALLALLALVATTRAYTFPVADSDRIPQRYNRQPTPVDTDYVSDYGISSSQADEGDYFDYSEYPEREEEEEEEEEEVVEDGDQEATMEGGAMLEEHFPRRVYETIVPTAPSRDPLADDEIQLRDDSNFTSAREMARLNIMDRILIALGPPFGEKLPKAPTNDTLATVSTPINITAEPCPYKYKRCSSQTFFPSCNIPRNTDPEVWPQRFNLYFNLSANFDSRLDVINATLRLFKNSSLPLQHPKTLLIKAYVYTKSLTKRRAKTTLVADAQVTSDYLGWVSLPVEKMVRRWKRQRSNHGLLVTVNDIDLTPWDAPRLFVIMDCASGLVPLPFEVQTDEEGQRYPALNVFLGSPDDEREVNEPDPSPSPVPAMLPESVTVDIQSDDPAVYDYDENGAPIPHRHPAMPSHTASLVRNSHAHTNTFPHGVEHSFGTGRGHVHGNNQPLGHNHQLTNNNQPSNNHQLGNNNHLRMNQPPTTSQTIINHQAHHGLANNYPSESNNPIDLQAEMEAEVNPRFPSTQATLTSNSRGINLGERGSPSERGSSGERGSWSQPTPATDEGRSQRQRSLAKERRHRKKHRQHHRRG
ncbi:uncharacterized protein LOC121879905 isoform X2 [Homarus americanus]|uniref:uncharacterized protein LOC121879905 isoform X2 n=1 Tax=Homarus americanus TaxID=6706 RepID=UPI001C472FB8|nr:uncharacterized protein LOC121879905 isoform X2 [Homarus americanus]